MYSRILDFRSFPINKSFFLLGPRQTGKTTLLSQVFKNAKVYNLLDTEIYFSLSAQPGRLKEQLLHITIPTDVIIDEIQLLPILLNEVHLLIEQNKNLRFILTGSSARKLKKSGVNLLGGRAWSVNFYPLTLKELGIENLYKLLKIGGLPFVFDSLLPEKELSSYIGLYLKEEIKEEGFVRNHDRFSRFLEVAGLCNGQELNFTKIGNDAGVPSRTVREYFELLKDTLMSFELPSYSGSKRKTSSNSKFYLFDVGLANFFKKGGNLKGLLSDSNDPQNTKPLLDSNFAGPAFEHLILLEIKAFLSYSLKTSKLSYWRTYEGHEVDIIIDDNIAIEVKYAEKVQERDEKNLFLFEKNQKVKNNLKKIIVSREQEKRITSRGTEIYPLSLFLEELWRGQIF